MSAADVLAVAAEGGVIGDGRTGANLALGVALAGVALGVLAIHLVEALWLVWPSYPAPGAAFGWLAALAPIAPIGLWLWAYLGCLAARPVTPPPRASFGEVPADG